MKPLLTESSKKLSHGKTQIIVLKTPASADCFLSLLTITIGREENAVKPHDLDLAIEHIADSAKSLISDSRFQRLSALARR